MDACVTAMLHTASERAQDAHGATAEQMTSNAEHTKDCCVCPRKMLRRCSAR